MAKMIKTGKKITKMCKKIEENMVSLAKTNRPLLEQQSKTVDRTSLHRHYYCCNKQKG